MKKIILYIILFCAVSFTSCVKEIEDSGFAQDSNRIENVSVSFGEIGTKCEASDEGEYLGESMYVTESGDTLYISAYLSDMDDCLDTLSVSDTKSTLIGSSNFGTATGYTSFALNAYKEGENTIYNSVDKSKISTPMENIAVSYVGGSTDYKWSFGGFTYFWPTDNKALNFCSYGPASEFGVSGSVSDIAWDNSTHTFSFNYTTPSGSSGKVDAENQKDIIVGVNQQAYVKGGTNNVNLTLKHPLLAVRFVLGDIFGKIEYISLNNFYSEGKANVTSSGISWSDLATKATFYQTFDNFDATDKHDTTGKVELDVTADKRRNFIIIPQQLSDDASMDIKLGSTLHPETLNFSKICKDGLTKDWTGYAGHVLTFRIGSKKANLVSVDIKDEVSGLIKQNIKVVNDGKSPIYIRAVLVGNWLNSLDNVLAPWSEEKPYGTFYSSKGNGFPNLLSSSNWKYNSTDGFYYYKKIIRSGHTITENLFDSFTLTKKPVVTTSSADTLLIVKSFELDIQVQAVSADTNKVSLLDVARMARIAWGIADGDVGTYFTAEKE